MSATIERPRKYLAVDTLIQGGRPASKSLYCLNIRIVALPILERYGLARFRMLAFHSLDCESMR